MLHACSQTPFFHKLSPLTTGGLFPCLLGFFLHETEELHDGAVDGRSNLENISSFDGEPSSVLVRLVTAEYVLGNRAGVGFVILDQRRDARHGKVNLEWLRHCWLGRDCFLDGTQAPLSES